MVTGGIGLTRGCLTTSRSIERYVIVCTVCSSPDVSPIALLYKPENGCEIQNAACGTTGIMMELRIVKGDENDVLDVDAEDQELTHGCKVMLSLLRHWKSRKERIVCADSYFASVQSARRLFEFGFRFIGVVKTATTKFPMKFLGSVELPERGTSVALTAMHEDDMFRLLAFVYCDRDRRYFISTCSNVASGVPIVRRRLRQVLPVESQADPESVTITMNQPAASEIYYKACGMIDRHNRARQATLKLEKKMRTKTWHKRVNTSILGMIIVDSFLLHELCTGGSMTQQEYYRELIQALIENRYTSGVASRLSSMSKDSPGSDSVASRTGTAGRGLHLTPAKRVADTHDERQNTSRQQRCRYCKLKTTSVCSECRDNPDVGGKKAGYCHPSTGRFCYETHMNEVH